MPAASHPYHPRLSRDSFHLLQYLYSSSYYTASIILRVTLIPRALVRVTLFMMADQGLTGLCSCVGIDIKKHQRVAKVASH